MNDLKLTVTHYKVLDVINTLNEMKFYPNQEGVYKILIGLKDDETKEFENLPVFGILISYSSKRICHLILALNRYGYLNRILYRDLNELFLTVSDKGKSTLYKYKETHKKPYQKKIKNNKTTIVKIG